MDIVGHIGGKLLVLGFGRYVHDHHHLTLDFEISPVFRGVRPFAGRFIKLAESILVATLAFMERSHRILCILPVFKHIERESVDGARHIPTPDSEGFRPDCLETHGLGREKTFVGIRLAWNDVTSFRQIDHPPRFRTELLEGLLRRDTLRVSLRKFIVRSHPYLHLHFRVKAFQLHGNGAGARGWRDACRGDVNVSRSDHREKAVSGSGLLIEHGRKVLELGI